MERQPKEGNRLEELQEIIRDSPVAILREFKDTANPWLSCFKNAVDVIDVHLESQQLRELIGSEKYTLAEARMESLKSDVRKMEEKCSAKGKRPPKRIREELLWRLNVLREKTYLR
jgi:hypothetical protein